MYARRHIAGRSPSAVAVVPSRSLTSRRTVLRGTSIPRAAAEAEVEAAPEVQQPKTMRSWDEEEERAFPYHLPMDPVTKKLTEVPLGLFYPLAAACVGVAGVAGSVPGRLLPVEDDVKEMASLGGGALLGAGAAYAAMQAKKKRESAAVVELYNNIVDLPEPYELTEDMVKDVGGKYGVDLTKDADALCRLYSQYLEGSIPAGDRGLKGDEADNIKMFKEALGLPDEYAAPCHVDLARRLYRLGSETKDRDAQFEQRKAFQRLVYVSQLVFGDQAAVLMSWRSHFELTEAQLYVARRDNAAAIFKRRFEELGGDVKADPTYLKEVREMQLDVRMFDESMEEVLGKCQREHVEKLLASAVNAIKATGKNKNISKLMSEMGAVLDYCSKMDRMAGQEELPPGLGGITVKGGPLAEGQKATELRTAYKLYLETRMDSLGEFSAELDGEAQALTKLLDLTPKEAQVIRDEVAGSLYRKLLKQEVVSKRLDSATDPAQVMRDLCSKVRFSEESAMELHKQLYRAKMASLVEKGRLTQADQADLARVRRILCIPDNIATRAAGETSGRILEDTVADIFMGGAKPVPSVEMERVTTIIKDLAVDREVALEVLSRAAKDRFCAYLFQAEREREDRREAAALIKKLIAFNLMVVSPMLDRIKGMDQDTHEILATQSIEDEDRMGQMEITVKDEIDTRSRVNLYKNYLMYTMQGDLVELPLGGAFRKKNNSISREAEVQRLKQLAGLLGMSQAEVQQAREDMAEEAFKAQVLDVMEGGPLTAERNEYLEELRLQLGVSEDLATKVLKACKSEVYGASATIEQGGGRWTLERVLEVNKAGGSIAGRVEEYTCKNIFRRAVESSVSDGKGAVSVDFMLKELPAMLILDDSKIRPIVKELVGTRTRMLLVQAVSQFRQKRVMEALASLNNLISCIRLLPLKEPIAWSERTELRQLYQLFCSAEASGSKRAELQATLGLTGEEVQQLTASSTPGSDDSMATKSTDSDDDFF